MKKILFLLAIVLCHVATVWAETVSPAAAREAAARFLQAQGASVTAEEVAAPRGGRAAADDPSPAYYVFNADGAKGFVVVSGDDCVGDNLVLGYTAQGSFSSDSMPEGLQWWLDATAERIATLSAQGRTAARVATHADIAPMVTSKWNQGAPYNDLCPTTNGQPCVTGCMATALAQVMRYHRWPQNPTAYALPSYTMTNGRTIASQPVTTFDWDNMLDDYSNGSTDLDQNFAVAELMRQCGQSLQMDYTPLESNAVCYDLDHLVNCFGYDPGVRSVLSTGYTVSGWDALIYNELQEGRPIVYSGRSSGGGHAFVIDGYEVKDGEGYYSVNWGWGGMADGYYKINLLNPDASGTGGSTTKDGYSYREQALIGFQPRKSSTTKFYRNFSALSWDSNPNGLGFILLNQSYRDTPIILAIVGRNSDGTPDYGRFRLTQTVNMPGFTTASLLTDLSKGGFIVELTEALCQNIFNGLAPGTHYYMFVSRESASGASWQPVFGPNNYLEVVIGASGQVTKVTAHPVPHLYTSSDEITVEGIMQRGPLHTVKTTVHNSASDDYIGHVTCQMYLLENGILKSIISESRTGIMIEAGGVSDIFHHISAPKAGDYVILMTKGDGTNVTGISLANIEQTPNYLGHKTATFGELMFGCLYLNYEERSEQETDLYCLDIIVDNGTPIDYDAAIPINVYKLTGDEYVKVNFSREPYARVYIPSTEWRPFTIYLSEPLEKGDYMVELSMANDFCSLRQSDYFTFTTVPLSVTETGVEKVQGVQEVQWVQDEWYDLSGRKLDGKPTQKGFYINAGKKFFIE